jgi:hypothetical protein
MLTVIMFVNHRFLTEKSSGNLLLYYIVNEDWQVGLLSQICLGFHRTSDYTTFKDIIAADTEKMRRAKARKFQKDFYFIQLWLINHLLIC